MFHNVASQKWVVFAFDATDGTPKTGDAANITAKIAKDDGTLTATNDTNPTELESGFYAFDLTQAETNAGKLHLVPVSATTDIEVVACPAVLWTIPANFPDLGIETDGMVHSDVKEIEGADPTDTIDARAQVGAAAALAAINLDHLMKTALGAGDVTTDSVIGQLASADGDFSNFSKANHSFQAIVEDLATRALADKVEAYFQLLMRSDAAIVTDRATELGEINADEGSGVGDFDPTADSNEAIADGGGGGGATAQQVWEYATRTLTANTNLNDLDAAGIRTALGMASADLDDQLDALPTAAEIKTAIEAAGSHLALILEDTGTTIPGLIGGLNDLDAAGVRGALGMATNDLDDQLDALALIPLDAAGVRTAIGLSTNNLDTQLSTIAGYIDTEVAAILAAVDTEIAAIVAKLPTNYIMGSSDQDPHNVELEAWEDGGRLDSILDSIVTYIVTTGVTLSAAQMNKIADHVLRRTAANARASSDGDTVTFRSLLGAVSKLVNKLASASGTLTIYEEDDASAFATQTLTTDADADPIVTMDTN